MPSRLTSLLVRDGLVGVKRMEKAFQRQVIYGGSIDTILLEMNLIPEDQLIQYLALASGLPPAERDEGDHIDLMAVDLIPQELAEQYRAVPVSFEGDALRVLVCSPLEIAELEDLADMLDRALQPLITPEYRWNLVFAIAYGFDPPARFKQLAHMLDAYWEAPDAIAGQSMAAAGSDADFDFEADTEAGRTYVEPTGPSAAELAEAEAEAVTAIMTARTAPVMGHAATQPLPGASRPAEIEQLDEDLPSERPTPRTGHTIVGVAPNPARADAMPVVRVTPPSMAGAGGSQAGATPGAGPGKRVFTRPPPAPISTEGRDTPLPIVRAREQLATIEDRDTVFLTLLRAARSRARWTGLLTIQGGAAIGRFALAQQGLDTAAITTVLIPLDIPSPFRNVVSNKQSHVGPLVSGDPGIDAMVERMGGTTPPSGLILPIVLRDRVVAILVAHRVNKEIRLGSVAELLPMATATSDALSRLIVKNKASAQQASQPPTAPESAEEAAVTKRLFLPSAQPAEAAGRRGGPSGRPTPPSGVEVPTEFSIEAEPPPPRPIDDVLWAIESATEGSAQGETALAEAMARAPEALEGLEKRFPGKLRVDRFAVSGRALRPSQYGGLLELVLRFGVAASDLLVNKLASPDRDIRFYAVVCAVELRPRNAVGVLAERLFDQDYGVRACAIEALSGYPPAELEHAASRARSALQSPDTEIVGAATHAIVELGDVNSVEELIAAVERTGRIGEHVRRALVALTAQDFGPSEKKWRKWWEGAARRHRIEWLIEGLAHKDDPIREAAIHDLRRLTGEYFGYHHDLPRRERDLAAERWAAWWRETGQRRFKAFVSERHRPTAKIRPQE
jgi:hypothetical protein